MADATKPDLNMDDWDSLPLEPDTDGWDDIPESVSPALPPDSSGQADDDLALDTLAVQAEPVVANFLKMPENLENFHAFSNDVDPILEVEVEVEPAPVSSPAKVASFTPIEDESPVLDDFISTLGNISDFEIPSVPVEMASPLPEEAAAITQNGGKPGVINDVPANENQFNSNLPDITESTDVAGKISGNSESNSLPEVEYALREEAQIAVVKKVELDIDGIFLEDAASDHEPQVEMIESVPEPEAEPAPETEVPAEVEKPQPKKKIPRAKLLLVIGLAFLVFLGLAIGLFKLFFSSGAGEAGQSALIIDPNIPPREPNPGEIALKPFYINFPAGSSEIIIEMTVTIHYEYLNDRPDIERRLTAVRDVIYRVTQAKGAQVATNGELQRSLRQELVEKSNLVFNENKISYVQIDQIRILQ